MESSVGTGGATHDVDGVDEVLVEVGLEGVVPLGGLGPTPVEQEDVEAFSHEPFCP